MLFACDLSSLDHVLYKHYERYRLSPECSLTRGPKGAWFQSGPGPVAFTGDASASSVLLAPEYRVIGLTRLVALTYQWDSLRLGAWASECCIRVIVADAINLNSCVLDATLVPNGAVIVPAAMALSANCGVVFQLKAGTRANRLKDPPFVRTCSIQARYRSQLGSNPAPGHR